jgi:hypothetical protein
VASCYVPTASGAWRRALGPFLRLFPPGSMCKNLKKDQNAKMGERCFA